MFLSGIPADIRLGPRERDEENEQMTPTLYIIGPLRSKLINTLTNYLIANLPNEEN